MNQEPYTILTEETFVAKIVPFFEEQKSKLLSILGNDRLWQEFISRIHLVYIDNSKVGRVSYFYLTDQIDKNLYLADAEPTHHYNGFSTEEVQLFFAYKGVLDCLKYAFIEELMSRATPDQLAAYMRNLLESNYRFVDSKKQSGYFHLSAPNIKFSDESPLFSISAYRVNIVIPIMEVLDASEIPDETHGNKKILLTNRANIEGYKNFDQTLSRAHLSNYFDIIAFTLGVTFYKNVLGKSYKEVFEIIELLRTVGDADTFKLKADLVSLDISDGKALEAYLTRFLKACFSSAFDELEIKEQVPNRGRLRVRDFVIVNKEPKSPFLRSLGSKGVDFLLIDAKNYAKQLSPRDIDTFKEYLRENQYFGNFGIMMTRAGASENTKESLFRSLTQGTKILILDEGDLLEMLEQLDSSKDPTNVLEKKYHDLLLQL